MSYKYSILTFNFNNYDLLREPKVIDPECEYICISDNYVKSEVWNVIVSEKLKSKNPFYSSFYVRYHPFEFVSTDVVIIIDASIQINADLNILLHDFKNSEMCIMVTPYNNYENKIKQFVLNNRFIEIDEPERLNKLIKEFNQENILGSVGTGLRICRNTDKVNEFNKECFDLLIKYGKNDNPVRLDEVPFHALLTAKYIDMRLMVVSSQVLNSYLFTYMEHKLNKPAQQVCIAEELMYLCNIPIKPLCYGNRDNYPRSYLYKTEAILLTKYLNESDLREWLDWHLNICKIEHIHVIDNESDFDVKSICKEYGNRVSYDYISGHARQYKLYNDYIKYRSNSAYIIPIDDDEYLEISKEFNSLYDAIKYYDNKIPHLNLLCIRWKHLFPKKFKEERLGKVLDYCTEENPELAKKFQPIGDLGVKTIVRRYGEIYYEEASENPNGGHIPMHNLALCARGFNGKPVCGCAYVELPKDLSEEKIRLIHCRYKGPLDYQRKFNKCITVSNNVHKIKQFEFDKILPTLE